MNFSKSTSGVKMVAVIRWAKEAQHFRVVLGNFKQVMDDNTRFIQTWCHFGFSFSLVSKRFCFFVPLNSRGVLN